MAPVKDVSISNRFYPEWKWTSWSKNLGQQSNYKKYKHVVYEIDTSGHLYKYDVSAD